MPADYASAFQGIGSTRKREPEIACQSLHWVADGAFQARVLAESESCGRSGPTSSRG